MECTYKYHIINRAVNCKFEAACEPSFCTQYCVAPRVALTTSLGFFLSNPNKVSVLWAGGSVLVQHIDDIGFEEPFVFVYIASSALAGCIPSYLFAALLGLVRNPPLRDASGAT